MAKTPVPIVNLYFPDGSEVLLGDINVCAGAVISFSYKYSEKDDDKSKLVLRYNTQNDILLEVFKPGTFYDIRWGYINNLSPRRSIAINKLNSSVDSSGYTITLELIPRVLYKDSGSNWASVKDMIDSGTALGFKYRDIEGTEVLFRVTRKEDGTVNIAAEGTQEGIETIPIRKADLAALGAPISVKPYMFSVDPYSIPDVPRTADEAASQIMGLRTDYVDERIMDTLKKYIARALKEYFIVDARDDEFIVKPLDTKASSLTIFQAKKGADSPLISLAVSEGSKVASGLAQEVNSNDPLNKEASTSLHEIKDLTLPKTLYWENRQGKIIDTVGVVKRDPRVSVDYLKEGEAPELGQIPLVLEPHNSSKVIPLSPEESAKYTRQILKSEEIFAKPGVYSRAAGRLAGLDRMDHFQNSESTLAEYHGDDDVRPTFIGQRQSIYNDLYQIITKRRADFRPADVQKLFKISTSSLSKEEALNQVQQLAIEDYYNQVQCKVVLVGAPPLTVSFNFNALGLGRKIDGKFHCSEASHSISGGRYTTTLVGLKIPTALQINQQIASMVKYLEKSKKLFDAEDVLQEVADNANIIFSDEGFKAYITNQYDEVKRVKERGLEFKRVVVSAANDTIPRDNISPYEKQLPKVFKHDPAK